MHIGAKMLLVTGAIALVSAGCGTPKIHEATTSPAGTAPAVPTAPSTTGPPLRESQPKKWEGEVLEEKFQREGVGKRPVLTISIEQTNAEAKKLASRLSKHVSFMGHMMFTERIVVRSVGPDGRYRIKAMTIGVDPQTGEETAIGIPFAPGTIFEVHGLVKMLGVTFRPAGERPFVFVLLYGSTNKERRMVLVGGEGTIVELNNRVIRARAAE